jgi:hypothetical protein
MVCLIMLLLLVFSIFSSDTSANILFKEGSTLCVRHSKGFTFTHNEKSFHVPNHMASRELRSLDTQKIAMLLASDSHYLVLNECADKSYSLDIRGRVNGGGPIAGQVGYWGTKVIAYGVIAGGIIGLIRRNKIVDEQTAAQINSLPFDVAQQVSESALDKLAYGPIATVAPNIITDTVSGYATDISVGVVLNGATNMGY